MKYIFIFVLLFSTYHLIRDIAQILNFQTSLITVFHEKHLWCNTYCDYVTVPLEVLDIIGSVIVLKRNEVGWIGKFTLISLVLWPIMQFLP